MLVSQLVGKKSFAHVAHVGRAGVHGVGNIGIFQKYLVRLLQPADSLGFFIKVQRGFLL